MNPTVTQCVVRTTLDHLGVPGGGETVVVGLSGGADSVALVDTLAELGRLRGFAVVAAHLDHGLRRDAADDAAFCANLCAHLGVPLECGRADVRARAAREGGGLEDAARRERYAFLRRVKQERGAAWIAVAHTRDDQAETLLLRLLRGAGLTGLRAMRPRSGDVLRPLLRASRADVLHHLAARGLAWREDPTNADPALLRNRVRHELLPYLEARFNPQARAALARSAALLADDEQALRALVDEAYPHVARSERASAVLACEALAALQPAVARGVARRALDQAGGLHGVAAVHVERLLALARSARRSGRRLALPGRREALVRFGEIWIGPRARAAGAFAFPLRVPGRIELPAGRVLVARADRGPAVSNEKTAVVAVPAEPPLAVRTRLPGDRVRAKGREMSLKRFLIDRRVPADLRAGLPLVAAGRQVLWVAGQTLDAPDAEAGRPFVRLELVGAA